MKHRWLPTATALLVFGLLPGAALAVPEPDTAGAGPRTQTFQAILLQADNRGQASEQSLPEGAAKALQDVRRFLPFKNYRMVDMAWLRVIDRGHARLAGPSGQKYHLSLSVQRAAHGQAGQLLIDSLALSEETKSPPLPEGATPLPPANDLISTSFGMQVGETVVVGVSKLPSSDEALVVLLTAIP